MPTIREIVADDKARGVPEADTRARLVKHGIADEDFGLDLPAALAKGKARLAVKAAPPALPIAPPKPAPAAAPLSSPATPVGLPEPATAPASVIPTAPRVGPPTDMADWARRKMAAAVGVPPMFGVVEREKRAKAEAEDRVEYPTPGRVVERSREMALGGVLGLGGDTRTAQAVKAIKAAGEAAPTFLEDVTGAFGLIDPPLIGRSKAEREKQLGAAVQTQLKPLAKSLTDPAKAKFVETADTSRFTKPFEAMEQERQTRRAGGTAMETTHRWLVNAKDDIANVVNSLAHLAGEVGGVTVLEPGETTASRAAKVGGEVATGLVGATGSLAKGLAGGADSSLYTHPLTTVLTFLPMVKAASLAAKPGSGAALAKVRGLVTPVVDTAVMDAAGLTGKAGGAAPLGKPTMGKFQMPDNLARVAAQWGGDGMNPGTLAEALASVKRALADGVIQADPRATAIVGDIIHAPEQAAASIRNLVERAARQVEQGKVRPVRPQLERTELRITPAADDAAAATAERAAEAAVKQAGEIRGRADAAAQAADEARGLRRQVEGAQRQAFTSLGQIARSTQLADEAIARGMPRVAAAAEKPAAAFMDVADATVSLTDRIAKMPIPKVAANEIAATRAAKAFERAQAEYIAAAQEAKVNPSTFAKEYAALAAEELGPAGERLAAKQVAGTPTAEARAAAQGLAKEGRAAESVVFSRLRAFEKAQEALGTKVGRILDKTRAEAGKAGAAGIRAAEAVQAVEPRSAAQMAQESASLQRAPAAKAERLAERAGDVAERAGVRPEVYAGDVYLPPEHPSAPGSFTAANVERAFGVGRDVAEATVAIADAMGLDKSKIRVARGGTPGAGALTQADGAGRIPATQQILARLRQHEWLSPDAVIAKYGIDSIPDYLNGVAEFIAEQNVKLREGRMTARDVAKAYINTITSIKAQAQNAAGFEAKTGFKLPPDATTVVNGKRMVRPEDATSAWLLSPEGKTLLNAVEAGVATPEMWQPLVAMRDAFGSNAIKNWGLSESKNWNLHNLPEVTAAINAAKGESAALSQAVTKLVGVGARKDGFIKHLLGLGDTATVDARAVMAWLGEQASPELAKWANEITGPGERFVVQQVQSRVNEIVNRLGLDPQTGPHLVHHLIWDRFKGESTSHKIIYDAMRLAQDTKGAVEFLPDGTALIRALRSPDASTGVHELAHIARRWVLSEEGGFSPEQVRRAEDWAGAKAGKWDVAAEEKFARGFERYLRDGVAPTAALGQVFAKFKDWLGKIYAKLTGSEIDIEISPSMRGVYEALVQGQPVAPSRGNVLRVADWEAKDALGRPLAARPLGEAIPETPTEILEAIRRESQKVGDLQAAEVAAGFDADARVFAGPLQEMGLPPYTRIGEAGRAFAADVVGRNLDNPQAVIAEKLRQLGAERGAGEAAARLLAEQELLQQTKRIDTAFGAIRRPTPVVTELGMTKAGEIPEMPRSAAGQLRAALDEASGARESLEPGAPRRARQEGLEMGGGRTLQPEAPRSTTTDNPVFNESASEIAKRVRDVYFPKKQTPALEIGDKPLSIDTLLSDPGAFDAVAEVSLKRLSDLRIAQRLGEALADDTAQLIRSKSVQRAALDEFSRRLQSAGFGRMSKPWRQAMGDFAERLRDPDLASAISKNRFFEVKAPDGTPLWTRKDFADIQRAIPKERLAKVRAEVVRAVGDQMAEATHAYGVMREMGNELYRFYKTPTGEVLPQVPGNPGAYTLEVARRVLKDGEIAPQMMPYSGAKMFSMLSGEQAAMVAAEIGVPVAKVESLGRYLRDYASAGGDKGLAPALGAWWSQVFQHTEPPGGLVNMYVNPGVADSLRAHFFMLAASDNLGPAAGLAREVFQRSKAGVVAENVKSLVNNNLSNTMLQALRRGDPAMLGNIVLAPLQFKAYLDGNLARLSPADVRMYKALSGTNIVQGAQLSRELGKSRLWEAFGKQFTGTKKAIERADVVTGRVGSAALEPIANLQDALREAYTSLGDMPFRLEEATAVFRDADAKVRMLKPGESLTVQTGPGKHAVITRVGEGVEIQHRGGSRATRPAAEVGLDSPELAQTLADAANVAQERVFFDYSKIGNLGKLLRGSVFTGLSGIFSWFFKATDIPGIKRGLLSEMVSGPPRFSTTSPAVQSLQTRQSAQLAAGRAMLVQAGTAAYANQRKLTDAPGAVAYDPATKGMILAASTNPEHVMVRNVAPLQFGGPSGVVIGGLANLAGWLAFRNIMNNPDDLEALLKDPPPGTKLDPDTVRRRQLLRDHATGKNFSRKQALQMVGLGGGPILQILDKYEEKFASGKPYETEDAMRDFGYAMFGATPSTLLNVGAAGLYEAGVESALPWSTYGKELRSHAFAGGVAGKDEAGFLQWAMRSLLGVGWQQILFNQYAYKQNVATGGAQTPRAKAALQDVSRVLKGTLLKAADERATGAAKKHGANSAEHQKALNQRININEGINALVRQMGENIAVDAKALGIPGVTIPTIPAD